MSWSLLLVYTQIHTPNPRKYPHLQKPTPLPTYTMPSPPTTTTKDELRTRSIPHMTLSTGDASSMTGPPPPMPHYLSSEGRAIKRFAVEGNAICTSTHVSRVLSPPFPYVRPSHPANKDLCTVTGGAGTLPERKSALGQGGCDECRAIGISGQARGLGVG